MPRCCSPQGYNTMCAGQVAPAPDERRPRAVGPFDHWPLRRGFDRFYGFLRGETDQWHPELVRATTTASSTPRRRAGLPPHRRSGRSRDRRCVREQTAVAPDRPFFLYLALGACHAPAPGSAGVRRAVHGALRRRAGTSIRDETLARQKALGIVPPADTELPPRNAGVRTGTELSTATSGGCSPARWRPSPASSTTPTCRSGG